MSLLLNYLSPQAALSLRLDLLKAKAAKHTAASNTISALLPFRGASLHLQSSEAQEIIISGPSETGKTIAALARIDMLCRQYREVQAVIMRKVLNDTHNTCLQTYLKRIKHSDVQTYGGNRPQWFDYQNGSRIWIGGMDRPGSTLSGERDIIYPNQAEEFSLEDWEYLTTRATGRAGNMPFGQVMGDCNPSSASHWILNRPSLQVLESRHEDNPILFDDAGTITAQGVKSMAVLDALTGVRKERLRYGRWVNAEGTVYEFDRAIHLIDRFEMPQSWRRIRIIDFGFTNPFICLWLALDDDDRAYLYREIYMTQRIVEDHAADIKRYSAGESIEATISDHDAEDRATLERYGITTQAAIKDVSPGIQAVQNRLRKAGDGKPRLFVMRDSLVERDETLAEARRPINTEQEFDVYSWPKSPDGRAIKEAPLKLNDHAMDALRYGVMYLDTRMPAASAPVVNRPVHATRPRSSWNRGS